MWGNRAILTPWTHLGTKAKIVAVFSLDQDGGHDTIANRICICPLQVSMVG